MSEKTTDPEFVELWASEDWDGTFDRYKGAEIAMMSVGGEWVPASDDAATILSAIVQGRMIHNPSKAPN